MKITSVINYKGGVGKTSVTANLAGQLAWMGYRILMLDLDPQASLTFSFIKPEEWRKKYEAKKTIKAWFDSISEAQPVPISDLIFTPQIAGDAVQSSGKKGKLDLVASHLGLINVDLELATQLAGGTLSQAKASYLKVHRRLAEGLTCLNSSDYDLVLIDCPPNFNIVTKNALVAADSILIPAKPDYLSTLGIDYLQNHVKALVSDFNEYAAFNSKAAVPKIDPKIVGVVFTMVSPRNGDLISALRPFVKQTEALGVPVFPTKLRENKTVYADAPQYGRPVVLTRYTSPSHKMVVTELETFADEFADKIGLPPKND
jgi:chromosome partitioning protein